MVLWSVKTIVPFIGWRCPEGLRARWLDKSTFLRRSTWRVVHFFKTKWTLSSRPQSRSDVVAVSGQTQRESPAPWAKPGGVWSSQYVVWEFFVDSNITTSAVMSDCQFCIVILVQKCFFMFFLFFLWIIASKVLVPWGSAKAKARAGKICLQADATKRNSRWGNSDYPRVQDPGAVIHQDASVKTGTVWPLQQEAVGVGYGTMV